MYARYYLIKKHFFGMSWISLTKLGMRRKEYRGNHNDARTDTTPPQTPRWAGCGPVTVGSWRRTHWDCKRHEDFLGLATSYTVLGLSSWHGAQKHSHVSHISFKAKCLGEEPDTVLWENNAGFYFPPYRELAPLGDWWGTAPWPTPCGGMKSDNPHTGLTVRLYYWQ